MAKSTSDTQAQTPPKFDAIRPLPERITTYTELKAHVAMLSQRTKVLQRAIFWAEAASGLAMLQAMGQDPRKAAHRGLVEKYVGEAHQATQISLEYLVAGNDQQFQALTQESHLCAQMAYWLGELYARKYRASERAQMAGRPRPL